MIKVISHNDLDGKSCIALADAVYGQDNVSGVSLDLYAADKYISDFIDELSGFGNMYKNDSLSMSNNTKYESIFITDLGSISEDTAEKIDAYNKLHEGKILVIDHHETSKYLNKYSWAIINTHIHVPERELTCGAELLFYTLLPKLNTKLFKICASDMDCLYENISKFITLVKLWDTWMWKSYDDDKMSNLAKDLHYTARLSLQDFRDLAKRSNYNVDDMLYKADMLIAFLKIEENEIISKTKASAKIVDIKGSNCIIAECESKNASMVGNVLCSDNDIDFAILIDHVRKTISFRSSEPYADCAMFAQSLGGGGHYHSAGCKIPDGCNDNESIIHALRISCPFLIQRCLDTKGEQKANEQLADTISNLDKAGISIYSTKDDDTIAMHPEI